MVCCCGASLLPSPLAAALLLPRFNAPVHVWGDLPCAYPTTKCLFSPDEQVCSIGAIPRNCDVSWDKDVLT